MTPTVMTPERLAEIDAWSKGTVREYDYIGRTVRELVNAVAALQARERALTEALADIDRRLTYQIEHNVKFKQTLPTPYSGPVPRAEGFEYIEMPRWLGLQMRDAIRETLSAIPEEPAP